MSHREHEPLTPEERAMAQRLSRLESTAAPSPALDARILAMARGASGAGATPGRAAPPRVRPRWPVAMGLAASLVVAVGVAWQLRPLPDSHVLPAPAEHADVAAAVVSAPVVDEAPAASLDAPGQPDAVPDARALPLAEAEPSPAPAMPPQASTTARPATERDARVGEDAQQARARGQAADAPARRQARPAAAAPAAPEAAAQLPLRSTEPPPAAATASEEVIEFVPPPPPPPPPAPPAPQAPSAQAAPAPAAAVSGGARAKASARAADRILVTGTRIEEADGPDVLADQPLDDRPPASADSPGVREHWLQRIRELHAAGEVEEARTSLREFVRRHPHAKVPADLRPLLDE